MRYGTFGTHTGVEFQTSPPGTKIKEMPNFQLLVW
jgi:hypothetical protein